MASEDCRQFYRRQGEAARPFTDAASAGVDVASGWKPAAPKVPGRDSLLALFTTAVSRQGRRPCIVVPVMPASSLARPASVYRFLSSTSARSSRLLTRKVSSTGILRRHLMMLSEKHVCKKNPDRPSAIFSLPAIQTAQGQVQFIGNTPHLFPRFVAGLHSAHGLPPDLCADPFHGRGGFPYPV